MTNRFQTVQPLALDVCSGRECNTMAARCIRLRNITLRLCDECLPALYELLETFLPEEYHKPLASIDDEKTKPWWEMNYWEQLEAKANEIANWPAWKRHDIGPSREVPRSERAYRYNPPGQEAFRIARTAARERTKRLRRVISSVDYKEE